jgi:hypothetical protein
MEFPSSDDCFIIRFYYAKAFAPEVYLEKIIIGASLQSQFLLGGLLTTVLNERYNEEILQNRYSSPGCLLTKDSDFDTQKLSWTFCCFNGGPNQSKELVFRLRGAKLPSGVSGFIVRIGDGSRF